MNGVVDLKRRALLPIAIRVSADDAGVTGIANQSCDQSQRLQRLDSEPNHVR